MFLLTSDDYLKAAHSKVKLLSGAADSDKWAANLDQYTLKDLKERVDIEFSPRNKYAIPIQQ